MAANKFENIKIGDSCSIQKMITDEMIKAFACFSGDYNPVHMDEAYCKGHGLEGRIAHGIISLSFLSALIGMHLPGEGAVWLSQSIDFISPVYIGDTIEIKAVVTEKNIISSLKLDIITMKITITNQIGRKVVRGSVKVLVK